MEGKVKAHRANINKFLEFCERVCNSKEVQTSKGFLEGKSKLIDGMWSRITSTNDEIVEGVTTEIEITNGPEFKKEYETMEQEYSQAFDMFDKVTVLICKAMDTLNKEVIPQIQPLQLPENLVLQSNNSGIKLKPIVLPTFSGDYTKWISFRNMFESLVNDSKEFSDIQRMHYLKSSLSGDAARLISQFDVTETTYKPAYEVVKERYNNEVILIDSHVISILAQPDLKAETSQGLKELMDVTTENLRALQSLGIDTDSWDPILLLLLVQKMDPSSRRLWEQTLKPKTRPTVKEFLTFLANRYHALGCQQKFKFSMHSNDQQTTEQKSKENFSFENHHYESHSHKPRFQGTNFPPRVHQSFYNSSRRACPICSSENHSVFSCEKFREAEQRIRIAMVNRAKLCQRCLRSHQGECNQREGCRVCGGSHHTFLHKNCNEGSSSVQNPQNSQDTNQSTNSSKDSTVLQSNHISLQRPTALLKSHHVDVNQHVSSADNSRIESKATPWDADILLATAIVLIRPVKGDIFYPFRCLLDQGGEASHISKSAVQKLGLTKNSISASMCGLGGVTVGSSDSFVEFEIGSKINQSFTMKVQAVVVPKVTNPLPSTFIKKINWKHIDGLQLADPEFNKPSEIDIIFGASVYGYILLPGLKKAGSDCPVAQNTELGWILSGATKPDSIATSSADSTLETKQ